MDADLLKTILAQGGLGFVAVLMLVLFLWERKEHNATRVEVRGLLDKINDLHETHATRERTSLQTVEYFAKAQVEAVEELGRIASALRKAYDRLRR